MCVTIGNVRVLAVSKKAEVRVLNTEPVYLAAVRELLDEQIQRLGALNVEVAGKMILYAHVRDAVTTAQQTQDPKGARA